MKTLFKNSFFTFLKSKVSMILLAILMFLSTATFTLLSSTSDAFKTSFDNVVVEGKLHEFTIKEKYAIKGNLVYKVENIKTNRITNKTTFNLNVDFLKSSGNYKNQNQDIINELFIKAISEINNENKKVIIKNNAYEILNSDLNNNPVMKNNITPSLEQKILQSTIIESLKIEFKNLFDKHIYDNFEKEFRNIILSKYKNELIDTKIKSINVDSNKNKFKLVNGSKRGKIGNDGKIVTDNINKIIIFEGENIPQYKFNKKDVDQLKQDYPDKNFDNIKTIEQLAEEKITKIGKNPIKEETTSQKGYKAIAYYGIPGFSIPLSYIDPSSLMAVVSSSYVDKNNLHLISPSKVEKIYNNALVEANGGDATEILEKKIKKNYSTQVVWVDNTPYFIVGIGTTPDFSFPIISQENPIPDTKSQAILFVNKNGFKRIEDAFRNNQRENYIAYRFKDNVIIPSNKKQKIIRDVEKISSEYMKWGNNIKNVVSQTFDISEPIILAPHRISTLYDLQKTINVVTYVSTSFLLLFTLFVVILVIKRQIADNRKKYGILLANGYSKKSISFANTSIALIIASVSNIYGYVLGIIIQPAFLIMFKNYWTIPVSPITFNFIPLILTIMLPMIGISLLAFCISLWEIRGSIPSILHGTSRTSRNLSAKVLAQFKWIGIKARTSLVLFFTNISKMLLIFVSAIGSIVAISFSLSTYNKFEIAKTSSARATNYEYKLDLANPTEQGGLMKMMPIENIGISSITRNPKNIFDDVKLNELFSKSSESSYRNQSKFMIPNTNDISNRNNPFYQDGLIQMKSLLNVNAIIMIIWNQSEKLMPENQLNQANIKYNNFINFTARLNHNNKVQKGKVNSLTQELLDIGYLSYKNDKYFVLPKNARKINAINLEAKISQSYEKLKLFVLNGLKEVIKIYKNPNTANNKRLKNMPFFISYRNIISNDDDETFTRIEGKSFFKNSKYHINEIPLNVIGIKSNTNFINIENKYKEALNNFNDKNILPVIVNRFFIFKHQKNIEDTFELTITNHKERYNVDYKEKKITLKIVGIHESYADAKIYTFQDRAIKALGWTKSNEKKMFNGIFTKHKNSILFQSISLYSLSGLYPGTDLINPNSDIGRNIDAELRQNPRGRANNIIAFEKEFTLSPYVMAYKNVNWRYTNQYRFDSLVDISSKLAYIVQSIMLTLAILFILIISLMIILDNKRFISTMEVMGYRKKEISKIFFFSFIPTIIVGFFVAAPIAFGIAEAFKIAIASFGNIYIPISLTYWTLLISSALTLIIIVIVYWVSTKKLRKTNLQNAFE